MRSRLPVALGFLFFLFGNASSQTLDHDAHPLAPPVRIPHAVLFDTSTFHGFVSPHERKLETSVRDLLRVADLHHDSLVSGPPSPLDIQSWGKVDTNGKIHVYLRIKEGYEASSGIDSLLKLAPPVYPTAYKPRMRRIPVWLTASQIRQAITWNNIRHVRLVSYPHFNTGDVMSQGVSRIRADFISQIWPKATGAGVRVGVISDDCGSLPTDVAPKVGGTVLHSQLSELSPNPLIVDDSYTGSRGHEGLAMMEIVSDAAPGAPLAFATAGESLTEFATNVSKLAAAGCKVIVDDYTDFTESFFEDDELAAAIEYEILKKDVVYVTAAGNYNWFVQTQPFSPVPLTLHWGGKDSNFTVHNFKYLSVSSPINSFSVRPSESFDIALQWDDPFTAPTHDYDLMIVDANNNVLTYANSMQYGSEGPMALERLVYTNTTSAAQNYGIVISSNDPPGTKPAMLKLVAFSALSGDQPTYHNGVSSVLGHSTSANLLSVGAIAAQSSSYSIVEGYSSAGPGYALSSSTPPVLETRVKPDVVSMDGVSTGVYTFGFFEGTSAAAPHVAGLAALARSLFPSLPATRISNAIRAGCIQYAPSGEMNGYGNGRTDAFRTLALLDAENDSLHKAAMFVTTHTPSGTGDASSLTFSTEPVTIHEIFIGVTLEGCDGSQPLAITLTKDGARTVELMSITPPSGECWGFNPHIVLGDSAQASIQAKNPTQDGQMMNEPILVGYYKPKNPISSVSGFGGMNANGSWTLTVKSTKTSSNNVTIKNWGIYIR